MIEDTLKKIVARIDGADAIEAGRKAELLRLVDTLQAEVAVLSGTHGEHAESIASFTESSAREATRTQPQPRLLQLSLEGLSSSIEGFELTHPKLVQIVNAISSTLANLGI